MINARSVFVAVVAVPALIAVGVVAVNATTTTATSHTRHVSDGQSSRDLAGSDQWMWLARQSAGSRVSA